MLELAFGARVCSILHPRVNTNFERALPVAAQPWCLHFVWCAQMEGLLLLEAECRNKAWQAQNAGARDCFINQVVEPARAPVGDNLLPQASADRDGSGDASALVSVSASARASGFVNVAVRPTRQAGSTV